MHLLHVSDKESSRRSMFMLSDGSRSGQGASSAALGPQTSRTAAAEQLIELSPEIDITMVDEDEVTGAPPPQTLETTGVVTAQSLIPPPFVGQPSIATPSSPSNNSVSTLPQISEPPQYVSPQEVFAPPQSLEPPTIAPSHVVESPQTAPSSQALLPPVVRKSLLITQAVTPHPIDVSPVITASPSLVVSSPVLGSSYTVIAHQAVPPVAAAPLSLVPHQPIVSPTVTEPPLAVPSVLGSSQAVIPQQADAPQKPTSQYQTTNIRLEIDHTPQSAVVRHSPDLAGHAASDNSRGTATATSRYRLRGEANTIGSTQTRRDSIEGAPDIILSLGESGYELATPSSQQDPPVTFAEGGMGTSAIPDPSLDELIILSSQRSLEESLMIPMEGETNAPTTRPIDRPASPPHQQSLEGLSTVPTVSETATTTSNPFFYAPRVIPNYKISRSDFPSWLLERGRLDHVLSVEAGAIWEKLIVTWLRQERRLGFGLNEQLVSVKFYRTSKRILMVYHREQAYR